ncbi:hypothetical protein A9Q77_12180 [Marinomonas sp. 42_23_T18]|nr:hypothetical protein A9Q77_12180 [Marinomonas sp. 42_23_T18]
MIEESRASALQARQKKADIAFKKNQFENAVRLYEYLIVRLELDDFILKRLSVCYYRLGDYEQAVKYQRLVVALTGHDEDEFSLGLTLLRLGELGLADPYYQKRKSNSGLVAAKVPGVPLWCGQTNLKGKTIMLIKEQGNGDLIQFCRYARAFVNMGANVLNWVHAPLRELMKQQEGLGRVLEKDEKVNVHYHAYYLDLLPYLDLLEKSMTQPEAPYLSASQVNIKRLEEYISTNGRPKVGLFWSGSKLNQRDRQRSIKLSALAPIMTSTTGQTVDFYSLSNESKCAEINASGLKIQDLSGSLQDFSDLAAAISQMDLIISIDSGGAHLAGALGCPVIVMIDKLCDWRWQIGRSWYESMTLYQQQTQNQWQPVLEQVSTDFNQRVDSLLASS